MKETVLLFQIQDRKTKTAITTALLPLKVRVKQVDPKDYGKKLGSIAGTLPDDSGSALHETEPAGESSPVEALSDSMMILCGISGSLLDRVLRALRSRNVRIPYKAVLTPSNQEWTPAECLQELKKEHAAMTSGDPAHAQS